MSATFGKRKRKENFVSSTGASDDLLIEWTIYLKARIRNAALQILSFNVEQK